MYISNVNKYFETPTYHSTFRLMDIASSNSQNVCKVSLLYAILFLLIAYVQA